MDPGSDELLASVKACEERLEAIRSSAASESYGFGGISPADVAALLATQLGQSQLWPPLLAFLLDPMVGRHDKAPALDRLVTLRADIPQHLLLGVGDDPLGALAGRNADPFEQRDLPVAPEALRFCASYGLIEYGDVVAAIAQLSSSSQHAARVEAARSIPHALTGSPEPLWAAVTLLQLSHDRDPVVRSEAGRALGATWSRYVGLVDSVVGRVLELLTDDGILVPLLTIRGLEDADEAPPTNVAMVSRELAAEHRARPVREAAFSLLGAPG
jgi:HEAT repeat protein